ncbi:MAG: ROK family protein [Solobacterium sp.]|nr:ROK family protein [Solobacterium sp.]
MKLLALDFGGTFVKYGLVDDDANVTDKGEVPAPLDSLDSFLKVVTDLYDQFKDEVKGIAISMPGVIDSEKGYAFSGGAYTAIVKDQNILELLKEKVSVPCSVENDGKSAVLAEAWKGALEGISDGAAVIIGSGLGGGIIMDGRLRKGAHFASGEISGLMMESGEYGFQHFSATVSSTSALLMMTAAAKGLSPAQFEVSGFMSDLGEPDPNLPIYSGKDVLKWVEDGDPVTCAVFEKWIKNLTMVVYNLKMTLDPEKIVIGGGISRNPLLLKALQKEYDVACEGLKMFGMPETQLDVCRFSADANLIGAVYNWKLQHE